MAHFNWPIDVYKRQMLPRTVVVATDYFDQFVRDNGLMYVINADVGDEEILSEFVSSRLPEKMCIRDRYLLYRILVVWLVRVSVKFIDTLV